jgi:uncharacterized OB-fold protein
MLVRPQPRRHGDEVPFWEYVQARELRLQRCRDCAGLRYPPAPVCPSCLSEASTWELMSGQGTLLSWVVFHRMYFPELRPPYTVAAVQLTEGPILIANLLDVEQYPPVLGMPISVTFEEVADAAGDGTWWIYQWTGRSS